MCARVLFVLNMQNPCSSFFTILYLFSAAERVLFGKLAKAIKH